MTDTASVFRQFTKTWLERLEPLAPIETELRPDLRPIAGVEGVLFDVYGTLLISQSGDVDITHFDEQKALSALEGIEITTTARDVIDCFKATIRDHHAASRHPHPEVDIVEVWREVLADLERRGVARITHEPDLRHLAFAFELTNNAVWPMPGLVGALKSLVAGGKAIGIVSNAQFFTPIVLGHFLDNWWPFESDLTVYSYQLLRAKPDPHLFRCARENLEARGIDPQRTLYVGNDMLNDVYAAHEAGFKTVLFAGDGRSLRLRTDRGEIADLSPDRVVTSLDQIQALIA